MPKDEARTASDAVSALSPSWQKFKRLQKKRRDTSDKVTRQFCNDKVDFYELLANRRCWDRTCRNHALIDSNIFVHIPEENTRCNAQHK